MKIFKLSVIASTVALLTACGGGSSSEKVADVVQDAKDAVQEIVETPVKLGGIWIGDSVDTDDVKQSVLAFSTDKGEFRAISISGEQSIGAISAVKDAFTGKVTYYAPNNEVYALSGKNSIAGTVSGTIKEHASISGSNKVEDMITSTFNLTFDDAYNDKSSLDIIKGTYAGDDGDGYTEKYTISAAGILTGEDSDGCIANGLISIINSDHNMYRISATISDCGSANGVYTGLGAFTNYNNADYFAFSINSNDLVLSSYITKQ